VWVFYTSFPSLLQNLEGKLLFVQTKAVLFILEEHLLIVILNSCMNVFLDTRNYGEIKPHSLASHSLSYLKGRLREDEVLIHCDFNENYAMKYASEIQSVHFGESRKQLTLHTYQIYYKKNAYHNLTSQSMCILFQTV